MDDDRPLVLLNRGSGFGYVSSTAVNRDFVQKRNVPECLVPDETQNFQRAQKVCLTDAFLQKVSEFLLVP